jgi:soluble lytic murein transglycosylase-like protein
MARLILTVALLTMTHRTALAASDSDPEIIAVADEAGVEAVSLAGAVNTTGLPPRTYLEKVGELAPPVPVLSPRLACIARVESRDDPNATNPRSGAAGLFQFLWSTWRTTPQGRAGQSPYDPVAATAAAEWMIGQGRINEWIAISGGYC